MVDDLDALAGSIITAEDHDGPDQRRDVAAEALELIPGLRAEETGDGSLRAHLRRWGPAPLLGLGALNVVDELDRIAFITLAPDIRRSFDLSDAALGVINGLSGILVVLVAIPVAVLADRTRRRTLLAGVGGLLWGAFALLTGLVRNVGQLVVVRFLSGLGKATIDPVHGSLLADHYPAEARGRVYAAHQAANPIAGVIGPLFAGAVAFVAGGEEGWRWAFIAAGPLSLVAALAVLRLREPLRGQHERASVGAAAVDATQGPGDEPGDPAAGAPRVPLATAFRRLLEIRSLRYLYLGIGVMGFGIVSGPLLLSLHLEDALGVGELGRGVIFTVLAGVGLLGIPVGGVVADRLFRHDPAWPLFLIGALLVAYTVVTAAALYLPGLLLPVAVLALASAAVAATPAAVRQMVAATSPPPMRSLGFAMLGIYILLFGGFVGGAVFGAISDASSPRAALTLLVVPGVVAGLLVARGSRYVTGDIAMVVEDLREEQRAAARRQRSSRNLLEVRNLDFRYGSVQVLFDVDLDVPEGEIIALLGTNGAGKSTLLRAITGLDHPFRGSIRFDGHDVTYLEAEQLLPLGIAQMPGGKATFPSLSVIENLRVGAFTLRHDAARVEEEIRQVEAWFPVLAERRQQAAGTLSGGEQQMLALGKAFLTRPRLLCIDELSLGLSPAVTGALLEIVREMHRRGTTIVIVEQSLNVALSLASTAVFMEKGQVRFVGPAAELLERPDLARSVFLEGAGR
jgi:ABC-type branched-subunit amino acid transport system ATPase component/predicted MFS family arabinose efflux permease